MTQTRPQRVFSWDRGAWAVAAAAFAYFGAFRSRFVGGCDCASYYLEGLRFRGLDALHLGPRIPGRAALAPLCTVLHHGRVVSFFPPGFPLLLSIAGRAHVEFYATALLGAASGLALFAVSKARSRPAIAFAVMLAWLASPVVFFGSTQVMSDMPATAFGLFALVACYGGRNATGGALAGFSLGIRPTQVLILPSLALPGLGGWRRVVGGLAAAGIFWLVFLRLSLGSLSLPYANNTSELTGELFARQFGFLLRTTLTLHAPIVLLALVGAWLRPRRTLPLLFGFAVFVVFYSLWRSPFEGWWWQRFLLPVLPALFLAATEGIAALHEVAERRRRPALRGAAVALAFGVLTYSAWGVLWSPASEIRTTEYDEDYRNDAVRVARLVPPHALVAAVNHSAPLRLYGNVQSFLWFHRDAAIVLDDALRTNRPVFAVLGDEERGYFAAGKHRLPRVRFTKLERLPSGTFLERVDPIENIVDLGTPRGRTFLGDGWSGDEHAGKFTYVWALGRDASLTLPEVSEPGDAWLEICLSPFDGTAEPQTLDVTLGSRHAGRFVLSPGYQIVEVSVPAAERTEKVGLRFGVAVSPTAVGASADSRRLAAAVDWVALTPAR